MRFGGPQGYTRIVQRCLERHGDLVSGLIMGMARIIYCMDYRGYYPTSICLGIV